MARAGFDPEAVAGFFEKMQQATKYMRQPPEFLRTHPVNRSRISDARSRARQIRTFIKPESLDFYLVKARLALMARKPKPEEYQRLVESYQQNRIKNEHELYSLSLTASEFDDHQLAVSILTQLYFKRQRNLIYLVSLAEAHIRAGQPAKALPIVEAELKVTPTSEPLLRTYARALIDTDQPRKARDILLEQASAENAEPSIYRLLIEAQSNAGFDDEVHESQGLYLYSVGDLEGALTQFSLALSRNTDDPYSRTRVLARTDNIRRILRERKNRH
jgi:predicted Zn-dependent protease